MAGANEAEQTLQGAERTPPKPEMATEHVSQTAAEQAPEQTQAPGFGERGRMRRRARFLRKARELAYRDLGGLVFDLHRFGQRNDQLVLAKLATLGQIDKELRQLEEALRDRRPVTVLREVGIAACPRCAAIHGSDDRFCPGCGLAFDAHADRPISTAPVGQAPASAQAPTAMAPASHSAAPPVASQLADQASGSPPAPSPAPAMSDGPSAPVSNPATASPFAHTPASEPPVPAQPSPRGSLGTSSPPAPTPTATPTSLDRPPAPAPASPPTRAPETVSPPPVKPSAPPVAAKPAAPPVGRQTPPAQDEPARAGEDEPTQILRPPATGT